MKRTVLIVVGIVIALFSLPIIVGGVALAAAFGSDPTIQWRVGTARSSGYAVVSDVLTHGRDLRFPERFDLTIGALNQGSDAPVFIGYAPDYEVGRYLNDVPHTIVNAVGRSSRLDSDIEIPGSSVPLPPGDQTFWLVRATGTGLQEVELPGDQGSYRLVAMNADGSPDVAVAVYVSVTFPLLRPLGIALTATAGAMLAIGLVVLAVGLRTPRPAELPSDSPAGGPPAPPPGGPTDLT